ncbi:P-loop containing nucleoside triphosphate hydrolase protein [Cladochytrium replicatum]|nr:P-loop containing nucleoside triphosphate hydrolase protein [Cladochytrium replicatum]
MDSNVVLVGVGGPTCGGKSTLSEWLARLFEGSILHQDKFYKSDSAVPTLPDGTQDWDCPGSIDMNAFLNRLRDVKRHGTGGSSELGDNRATINESDISAEVLLQLKNRVHEAKAKRAVDRGSLEIIFVDGFLMYDDDNIVGTFDLPLFLKADYDTLMRRRKARAGYITLEGYWVEPEGYFDKVVYPNYLKYNNKAIDGNEPFVVIETTDQIGIERMVVTAVEHVLKLLR